MVSNRCEPRFIVPHVMVSLERICSLMKKLRYALQLGNLFVFHVETVVQIPPLSVTFGLISLNDDGLSLSKSLVSCEKVSVL